MLNNFLNLHKDVSLLLPALSSPRPDAIAFRFERIVSVRDFIATTDNFHRHIACTGTHPFTQQIYQSFYAFSSSFFYTLFLYLITLEDGQSRV